MAKGILWLGLVNQVSPVTPNYDPVKHFHVTLQYNVESSQFKNLIGKRYTIRVLEDCWNHEIQALRVELPSEIADLCNNANPHMTISHRPGIAPKMSNDMLQSDNVISTPEDMNLQVQMSFHYFKF
jgi:hypothetical protein